MRKGNRLPLEQLRPYLFDLPRVPLPGLQEGGRPGAELGPFQPPRPLDFRAIFGNDRPVELEVGFGKGAFLIAAASAHPDVNYLGVEIDRGLQLYVANRLAKRSLTNVRLIKADARELLDRFLAPDSLQAIHVYFPDPWWKKRHQKRRVFTGDFARACERVLKPGGVLQLATDVEEYFGLMTELLASSTGLVREAAAEPAAEIQTNFERKAGEQGRGVYRAAYRKLAE